MYCGNLRRRLLGVGDFVELGFRPNVVCCSKRLTPTFSCRGRGAGRFCQNCRQCQALRQTNQRVCLDLQNVLRRERRHHAENIDDCFFLADPSDPFGLSENTVTLQNALSVLDETEKKVVYQKYFMDFTVRDIAASLGMSKSTVQRTLDRAENKLRAYLSDE